MSAVVQLSRVSVSDHIRAVMRFLLLCCTCLAAVGCGSSTAPPQTAPCPTPVAPPAGTRIGHYVTAGGSSAGTGATDQPWDLQTALDGGGGRIHPGDTVWLRAGVYCGAFHTDLNGSPNAPIVFRQYPGERATIDGTLRGDGSNLAFWGFEVMQSAPLVDQNYVLQAYTANGRFINLVLHDAGISGVSMSTNAGSGVELYGSLVYNNGTHENLDHGLYAHNTAAGQKLVNDNIFFDNYARGIQIYEGSAGLIRNFHVEGNVAFNNGTIAATSSQVNLLISAPATTAGMAALDNLLYYSPGTSGVNLRLGNFGAQYNQSIVVQGNYAAGGVLGLQMEFQWDSASVLNNTIVGDNGTDMVHTGGPGALLYQWNGNSYFRDSTAMAWEHNGTSYNLGGWKAASALGASDADSGSLPATTRVFVRPNKYETGRANIIVYNWAHQGSVSVDLTSVVPAGWHYAVHPVEDFYGTAAASGTYGGGSISIPMTAVPPPTPIGRQAPHQAPTAGPSFDVFVLTSSAP